MAETNVVIDVTAKTTQARAAFQKLGRTAVELNEQITKVGTGMAKMGAALSISVTAPITALGIALISAGASAEELEDRFAISFGEMEDSARSWSEQLKKDVGGSAFAFRDYATTLNEIAKGMGVSKKAAFDMSTGMVALAKDVSSFTEVPMAQALAAIKSGLVGESEPLRNLGIVMSEATMKAFAYKEGIAEVGEELDTSQKALARYGLMLELTGTMQGNAADTADSATNSLARIKGEIEDLSKELGMSLVPIWKEFLDIVQSAMVPLRALVDWFTALSEGQKKTIVVMVGLVAAIGPVIAAAGLLVIAIGQVAASWGTLVVVAGTVKSAFATVQVATYLAGTATVSFTGTLLALKAALISVATTLTAVLGPALAAVAVGIAAYKITEWIMEWTGLRSAIDDAYIELFKFLGLIETSETTQAEFEKATQMNIAALASMREETLAGTKATVASAEVIKKAVVATKAAAVATKEVAVATVEFTNNVQAIIPALNTLESATDAVTKADDEFGAAMRKAGAEARKLALEAENAATGPKPYIEDATEATTDWVRVLAELGQAFSSFGNAAMNAIGQVIAQMSVAVQIGQDMKAGIQEGGVAGGMQAATAGIQGAGAIASATGTGSRGARVGKGAVTGAAMGAQLGGPIGAAVGAAVGAIAGALRDRRQMGIMNDIGRDYGIQISEGLADAIVETAKELDLGDFESTLLHLGDLLREAGGLDPENLEAMTKGWNDLLNSVALGTVPVEEGLDAISDAFVEMVSSLEEMGMAGSVQIGEMITRMNELGISTAETQAFITQTTESSLASLGTFFDFLLEKETLTKEEANAALFQMSAAFSAAVQSAGSLAEAMLMLPESFGPMLSKIRETVGEENELLNKMQQYYNFTKNNEEILGALSALGSSFEELIQLGIVNSSNIDQMAASFKTTFDEMLAGTNNQKMALQSMGPQIGMLLQAYKEMGVQVPVWLADVAAKAEEAGASLEPPEGLPDILADVRDILSSIATALGAVSTAGDDAVDSLTGFENPKSPPIADTLANINDELMAMNLNLGDTASTGTEAAGALSTLEPPGQEIINQIGAISSGLDNMASKAREAARAVGSIPAPGGGGGGGGGPGGGGGGGGKGGPKGAQAGMIVSPTPGGTMVNVGEGGETELILPVQRAISQMAAEVSARTEGGAQHIHVYLDGQEILDYVSEGTKTGRVRVDPDAVGRF